MTGFDPTTLNYDRPYSEWGDNERLYFPTLVEYVSQEVKVHGEGDAVWDANQPMALAALGFASFMQMALRLDLSKMVIYFNPSQASEHLIRDAVRNNL